MYTVPVFDREVRLEITRMVRIAAPTYFSLMAFDMCADCYHMQIIGDSLRTNCNELHDVLSLELAIFFAKLRCIATPTRRPEITPLPFAMLPGVLAHLHTFSHGPVNVHVRQLQL